MSQKSKIVAGVLVIVILAAAGVWFGSGGDLTGAIRVKKKTASEKNRVVITGERAVPNIARPNTPQPEAGVQSLSFRDELAARNAADVAVQTPPAVPVAPLPDLSGIARGVTDLMALSDTSVQADTELQTLLNQLEFGQKQVFAYCQSVGNAIPR
ncbi:hypothetical protein HYV58_01800 [Candidatus Peregrinibacteria bacterium]|nr:hypothetical protein [Candidatus Peregrinibacteria bacterium]